MNGGTKGKEEGMCLQGWLLIVPLTCSVKLFQWSQWIQVALLLLFLLIWYL